MDTYKPPPLIIEPQTLPVAVRGVMIRAQRAPRSPRPDAIEWSKPVSPAPRPRRFILIADPPPAEHYGEPTPPLLAVALIGDLQHWRVTHEVLVYRDDASASEIAAVEAYVNAWTERRVMAAGDGKTAERLVWRIDDRISNGVGHRASHVRRDEFRKLFLFHAHKHRHLCISFDVPRAAAHIAVEILTVDRGERFVKGWAFPLRKAPDGGWKKRTPPSIRVKRLASGGALRLELSGCGRAIPEEDQGGDGEGWHRGQFLALDRLAHSLLAEEHTLASARHVFVGKAVEEGADDPRDADDDTPIAQHRRRARAMLSLAKVMLGLFDRLPQSRARDGGILSETRVMSPAAISRALARMIGYDGAPQVPREHLGPAAAALLGGRIKTGWRGILPVASLDISKAYATIAALARLQDFLAAKEIRFEDATAEAREIAGNVRAADILQPTIWPKLPILCWCRLRGEVVPVHALFDGREFSMGMPYRWSDGLVPLWLPDVLAARCKGGQAPEIVRAERMIPFGRRHRLRRLRLPSGVVFDPSRDDLFRTLVEEGERLHRGDGKWGTVPAELRQVLYPGWKAGNNGLAFGSFAQTNVIDRAGEAREEVAMLFDEGELRVETAHPEEPGASFCLPLAGLVTACGRMLLAVIDELVAQKDGIVAAGHTDSAHIIATPAGGPVRLEVADRDPQSGVGRRYWREFHALSATEIEEIAAAFTPLNIFDKGLMPGSPLKVKGWGRALFLTAAHYCFLDEAGAPIDGTRSVLGQYLPANGDAASWHLDAWHHIAAAWEGRDSGSPPPWFSYPAVSAFVFSRPAYREKVAAVVPRPFDHFLVARANGRKAGEPDRTAVIIAPFESTPARWANLPWRFYETGELVDWEKPDNSGQCWRFSTIADLARSFGRIHPHAMLDAAGMPCNGDTRGPLRRMAMRDGPKYVIGKETLERSDDPALAFTVPPPLAFPIGGAAADPGQGCDWNAVRAAIAVIGVRPVARRLKLDPRSVLYWIAGRSKATSPRHVAEAVAACAAEAGLTFPADNDAAAVCASLPERVMIVRRFLGTAVELFAGSHGGIRELGRAMGIAESTLRDWRKLGSGGGLRPVKQHRVIAIKLARFARAEIRRARRRFSFDAGPIGDLQRVLVALSLSASDARPAVLPAERLYVAMADIGARLDGGGGRCGH